MALNNKDWTDSCGISGEATPHRLRGGGKEGIFKSMESQRHEYDIGLVWNWAYDQEFLQLVAFAVRAKGMSAFLIDHTNLAETVEQLKDGTVQFRFILDRASDEDERFLPLAQILSRRQSGSANRPPLRLINPYDFLRRASDKATMHLEFLSHGLHVPFTIIISPYNHKREVELSLTELSQLGRPFIIKPANTTGGGVGVVLGAESLKDIIETRQHHKNDKYLLQEKVVPAFLAERRAWFRVFYAFGLIIPCWWDDQTHIYEELTSEDEDRFNLHPLRSIISTIREICGLEFFSTEIALTPEQSFIIVDYVNEMCDMRLKSLHTDGVPDTIVLGIASSLAEFIADSGAKSS
jgi:glutathione synthase/RimK-type ligase-like ATP-grasp enzyme